jgi:hypothetical protein
MTCFSTGGALTRHPRLRQDNRPPGHYFSAVMALLLMIRLRFTVSLPQVETRGDAVVAAEPHFQT